METENSAVRTTQYRCRDEIMQQFGCEALIRNMKEQRIMGTETEEGCLREDEGWLYFFQRDK